MKLLIRNLPRSLSAEDLLEMFTAYGPVQSCNLVMDETTGQSKGFGFIEMPKIGDAKAAIKNLNGHRLEGNPMRVKKVEDRPAAAPAGSNTGAGQPASAAPAAEKKSPWK